MLYATICYDMLRYATVIVYNEQLPKSWGDKFSKMPKISGSVCFIFWPIPKSSEITSQVTWELTIFVCRFRVDLFPDKSPMCRDEHTLGAEGFWWFWYGSIGPSQPKKPSFRFKSHRLSTFWINPRITEQRTFAQAWWPTRNNEGCQYEVMTRKKYPNKTNGLIDIDTWEFFGAVEAPGVLSYGLTTALIFFIPDELSEIWQTSCWPFTSESKFEPGIRMQQGPIWHPYLLILFVGPFLTSLLERQPLKHRNISTLMELFATKPFETSKHESKPCTSWTQFSAILCHSERYSGHQDEDLTWAMRRWYALGGAQQTCRVGQLRWPRWWGVHNFAIPRL